MADVVAPNGFGSQQALEKTPFEKQRDVLIGQITQVKFDIHSLEANLARVWSKLLQT
jgi:hypothetical protein